VVRAWRWVREHPNVVTAVLLVGTNVAGWRAIEEERHDRCITSRTDTQAAFVAVVVELGAEDEQVRQVDAAVARALPIDEC